LCQRHRSEVVVDVERDRAWLGPRSEDLMHVLPYVVRAPGHHEMPVVCARARGVLGIDELELEVRVRPFVQGVVPILRLLQSYLGLGGDPADLEDPVAGQGLLDQLVRGAGVVTRDRRPRSQIDARWVPTSIP